MVNVNPHPNNPRGVVTEDRQIPGPHGPVPTRWYSPPTDIQPVSGSTIVWVHGGGFYSGGLDQAESHEVALALAADGFTVITVGYRLATFIGFRALPKRLIPKRLAPNRPNLKPSVHFPVPVDDVAAVVTAAQRHTNERVLLGGASAGACLSAGAVLRLAEQSEKLPAGVFFAYGLFHARMPARPPELRRRIRGLRRFAHMPLFLNLNNLNYAGSRAALFEPAAFPGGRPLYAFPPALMLDADHDSIRASGEQFARELAAAGNVVDYRVLPGTDHAFMHRPKDPAFAEGIRLISEWARESQSGHGKDWTRANV